MCESVCRNSAQKWVKNMSEICIIMWANVIHYGPLKEQFTPKPEIHTFPLSCRDIYPYRMLCCELPSSGDTSHRAYLPNRLPLFIGFLPGTQFSWISPDLCQPLTLFPLLVIITCFCHIFQERPLREEFLFNT